jgi:hypothetical protein
MWLWWDNQLIEPLWFAMCLADLHQTSLNLIVTLVIIKEPISMKKVEMTYTKQVLLWLAALWTLITRCDWVQVWTQLLLVSKMPGRDKQKVRIVKSDIIRKSFGGTGKSPFSTNRWYDRGDTMFIMVRNGRCILHRGMTHLHSVSHSIKAWSQRTMEWHKWKRKRYSKLDARKFSRFLKPRTLSAYTWGLAKRGCRGLNQQCLSLLHKQSITPLAGAMLIQTHNVRPRIRW